MSLLPPVDIFDHVDTRPVNERFSNYINKSTREANAKHRDIETARNIKGNLTYLANRNNDEIRVRLRNEYNPGFDDPVWEKLSACDKVLDLYDPIRVANTRRLFKDMRIEILQRKMNGFTYGYLEETSITDIVNDHIPPILEDYNENHRFAKLVTGALLTLEKIYRGVKK